MEAAPLGGQVEQLPEVVALVERVQLQQVAPELLTMAVEEEVGLEPTETGALEGLE